MSRLLTFFDDAARILSHQLISSRCESLGMCKTAPSSHAAQACARTISEATHKSGGYQSPRGRVAAQFPYYKPGTMRTWLENRLAG